MIKLISILRNNKLIFLGVFIGALCGYLYYYFVGCTKGTCMITSKPVNSSLYGSLVGGLLFAQWSSEKKKPANE